KQYPDIPIIGFPKGAGVNITAYARETGVDAVGMDSHIPPQWAAQTLQTLLPVQGNLDPFCLLAGGAQMEEAAYNILAALGGKPFVFNLGHGIHKDTPVEHVEKLVEIIRGWEV